MKTSVSIMSYVQVQRASTLGPFLTQLHLTKAGMTPRKEIKIVCE